ncbi:hypothetical protein [Mucilaginibacter flavidus]|uniref:hypothetical protein n=1 Tax=Mucilaginibacter flavidus TaxID=2949309 RepID=UPI002092E3A8|nr:hypothetical protein [Mucilaginibacter flavidus]MCO5948463.1 hypothetical protein [Mucilaginibacter flavidus]
MPVWVTSFSADDAAAFNHVSQLSSALNSAIAGNFNDIIKLIPDSLNSYACYNNLVTEAKNDEAAIAGQATSQANTFITALQAKLTAVYTAIKQFQKQKMRRAQTRFCSSASRATHLSRWQAVYPPRWTALKTWYRRPLLQPAQTPKNFIPISRPVTPFCRPM